MSGDILPGPRGFVASEGEQIYFESWGSGQAVVLSHGMGGNHVIWYQQVPALAAHYQVITWDQRGFGRSTNRNRNPGPTSAAGDLSAILDHLGVEGAHVVGQSMGGWAALGFALDHPDRALSLLLADTPAGIFTPDIRTALVEYGKIIATSPPPHQLPLGSHPALGGQLAREDLARSFLYGQIGGMATPPPPTEITDLLLATDHTSRIGELAAPTLFVVGEDDPIFPPKLIHEASSLISGSQVEVMTGAGHSPYFETPEAWNDTVLRFMQGSGLARSDP